MATAYVPNPRDSTQPVDSVKAKTAAAEFRRIKEFITKVPSAAISADYVTVIEDAGCRKHHPSSDTTARAWQIANLAYEPGTLITMTNDVAAGIITATVASPGVLILGGTGVVASIAIAPAGMACFIRDPDALTPRWMVSGPGLTGTP
jgi:hypothetical protein